VVPKSHDGALNEKQLVGLQRQESPIPVMAVEGWKVPEKATGYSPYTVYSTAYRTARFDLWLWEQKNEYKYPPQSDDAAAYMDWLAFSTRVR